MWVAKISDIGVSMMLKCHRFPRGDHPEGLELLFDPAHLLVVLLSENLKAKINE